MARKRISKRNSKIPKLDKEGTILEFLISGKSESGTAGDELKVSDFFDDTQGIVEEAREYYKAEIQVEIERRKNENDSGIA
jgi:hypothetical protein